MEAKSQSWVRVLFSCSLPCFLRQGLSYNLDLPNMDRLVGSRDLPVSASLALGLLGYTMHLVKELWSACGECGEHDSGKPCPSPPFPLPF
jgi:hypothetical protein